MYAFDILDLLLADSKKVDVTSLEAAQAGPGEDRPLTVSTEVTVGIVVGPLALTGTAVDPAQTPKAVCSARMALLHRKFSPCSV